jgi:molybdopterin-guanine dinucleotide biosynthesis adapter protein
MLQSKKPILGFSAHSGTGKTTLIEKLIPQLLASNIRVALIKHSHHNFDIDTPGKDSYRLRKAGAAQTLVASKNRWALMVETPQKKNEPDLAELINQIDDKKIDLILVEGFKHEAINKIALHRKDHIQSLSFLSDPNIIAIATDDKRLNSTLKQQPAKQNLDINNIIEIGDFISKYLKKRL